MSVEYASARSGTVIAVEYRLAPEHQAPTPVEDCYSALAWVVEHAETIGLNPAQIVLAGQIAGGGLATGTALPARDRGLQPVAGLLLESPMLDDRNCTVSIRQFWVAPMWSGQSNEFGWGALLGEARGTDDVSPYDAPARATHLGGPPPVHISVGSADPFRDEWGLLHE